jgi:glycosyltransferase involved in cell wall biosynthesis
MGSMTVDSEKWPQFSIVTPSFNQARFLEQTIRSVLEQDYPNIEYLIIDGGSTDGSVEIIRQYADRLAYWVSEHDRGQAHAINKGFDRASGDILCWINSDDYFFPGIFRQVAEVFAASGPATLVYGECLMFDADRGWSKLRRPVSPFDLFLFRTMMFFDQPSCFWTRDLWLKVGPLDETLHYTFDWDWFIRAAERGSFKYIPLLASAYRIHQDQKTGSGGGVRRQEIRQIVDRYADNRSREIYRAVDEKIIPTLDRLRWLGRMRGLWRLKRSAELIVPRLLHAGVYRNFGSQAVGRALTMLGESVL